ncbi:Ligand-binding domain of nuclear hormone receptor [Oesophagostomum dentatum]|uniref:Ligand-binding domain of nuclear hormone receptor n=1 Tax=Oesophagostomum dentatum TaxID=61180 RepID=A0A0B1TRM8_OESDE|nr:Ligand-binding domain of nuclear hormone receptor [Oesophagostomum dentatum]
MMEWGKCLPIMDRLLLNDKLALMKAFAPIFPLLQLAYYTTTPEDDNNGNGMVIKQEPDCEAAATVDRLNYPDGTYIEKVNDISNTEEMYTILIEGCFKLMRRLQIKQHHIVLYKMLLLHNPDAEGLSSTGKKTIEAERLRLLSQLFLWISNERGKASLLLFSNLLMMTATLNIGAEWMSYERHTESGIVRTPRVRHKSHLQPHQRPHRPADYRRIMIRVGCSVWEAAPPRVPFVEFLPRRQTLIVYLDEKCHVDVELLLATPPPSFFLC